MFNNFYTVIFLYYNGAKILKDGIYFFTKAFTYDMFIKRLKNILKTGVVNWLK